MESLYEGAPPRGASTLNVLVLLVVAAVVFSYLAAYALTNALLKAGLIEQWSTEHDPRPRWMLICFGVVLSLFLVMSALLRWSSNRQMRAMEAMEEAE